MVEILFLEMEFHYLFHFHFAFYFFVENRIYVDLVMEREENQEILCASHEREVVDQIGCHIERRQSCGQTEIAISVRNFATI